MPAGKLQRRTKNAGFAPLIVCAKAVRRVPRACVCGVQRLQCAVPAVSLFFRKTATLAEHSIRYRRPETPYSLSRSSAPDAARAAVQVARLIALGYSVVEVVPPLADDVTTETVEG
jgi:hypothetical protein